MLELFKISKLYKNDIKYVNSAFKYTNTRESIQLAYDNTRHYI